MPTDFRIPQLSAQISVILPTEISVTSLPSASVRDRRKETDGLPLPFSKLSDLFSETLSDLPSEPSPQAASDSGASPLGYRIAHGASMFMAYSSISSSSCRSEGAKKVRFGTGIR